jgi:hypothetical protein
MNRNFFPILTLALALATGRIGAADSTNAAPAQAAPATPSVPAKPAPVKTEGKIDYQSFRLITERNIFDMSRTGARIRNAPIHRAKVDSFTLFGTSSYEKGQFAFFDGSSSAYRQRSKPADSIAGYKIIAIGSDYVELQATNNKVIKMAVGTTIRREDNGPWSAPIVQSESFADTGSGDRERGDRSDRSSRGDRGSRADRSSSNTYPDLPPAAEIKSDAAASGGTEEDVIKRLMQKRAKEVKDDQ